MNMESGMSLVELMAILAIAGLALSATGLYLAPAAAPLETATHVVEGFFREARLRAIATTSAYRVRPSGPYQITSEYANSCSDTTWTASDTPDIDLKNGVSMPDTSWSVCFSSRGISSGNVILTLSHSDFGTRQIEVLLGGTTRVLP